MPGNRLLWQPTLRPLSPSQGPFFLLLLSHWRQTPHAGEKLQPTLPAAPITGGPQWVHGPRLGRRRQIQETQGACGRGDRAPRAAPLRLRKTLTLGRFSHCLYFFLILRQKKKSASVLFLHGVILTASASRAEGSAKDIWAGRNLWGAQGTGPGVVPLAQQALIGSCAGGPCKGINWALGNWLGTGPRPSQGHPAWGPGCGGANSKDPRACVQGPALPLGQVMSLLCALVSSPANGEHLPKGAGVGVGMKVQNPYKTPSIQRVLNGRSWVPLH